MPTLTPSDTAAADLDKRLQRLVILIENTDDHLFAFVRYHTVAEREQAVAFLKEQLSIPIREVGLGTSQTELIPRLQDLPPERSCVHIYDVEAELPRIASYLNLNREAFRTMPHAMIFWVGDYGIEEIARNAPDVWAWRSGVFDVRSTGSRDMVPSIAYRDINAYTNHGDLERRASMYCSILNGNTDHQDSDKYKQAKLKNSYASVLESLHQLSASKAISREVIQSLEDDNIFMALILRGAAYQNLGIIALREEQFTEAEKYFRCMFEWAEQIGSQQGKSLAASGRADALIGQFKLEEAERELRRAENDLKGGPYESGLVAVYSSLGRISELRHDVDQARRLYDKALSASESTSSRRGLSAVLHRKGLMEQQRQNYDAAQLLFERAVVENTRNQDFYCAALSFNQLGKLALIRGDYQESMDLLIRSSKRFSSYGDAQNARIATATFLQLLVNVPETEKKEYQQAWLDNGLPPVWADNVSVDDIF